MTAKTSAQRQKASDERHRKAGRVQRKVWATPDEHEQIKEVLDNSRFQDASKSLAEKMNREVSEIEKEIKQRS